VGIREPDDAAAYRLADGRVLIASVDFFTPIVDDAHDYGRIAAANALSDVYAMGGEPFLALSVAAFPADLPASIMSAIVEGAAEKVQEAEAVLAGGHTVRDKEPKFGLSVLGFADEPSLILKSNAREGDLLYLCKPIGTGILSTALKKQQLDSEHESALIESMSRLSARDARAARAAGVRAGTDVTGFSLAGHALEIAEASGVHLVIEWSRVPVLGGARDAVRRGLVPGGSKSNASAFSEKIVALDSLDDGEKALLFDPQTSGGLLLAVPGNLADAFESASMREESRATRIGRVTGGSGLQIET